ncbi:hypothetical protein K8R03_04825 [Candidatus Kaiserbacteria bacterium]|nr:hypothetical protein [Candidatus Kaiserbacteria bacterium]
MHTPSYRVLLSDYRTPDISGEVPFLCKRAGALVEVYCAKDSWLRKNSYHDAWHEADVSSREAYVAGLVRLIQHTAYDWIVLTEDEALQAVVDLVADETIARQVLPLINTADRAFVGSKAVFSRMAKERGLSTPRYVLYREGMELSTLAYPLLLKVDRSSGGTGVFVCAHEHALKEVLAELPEYKKVNAVLQEYVTGETIAVEAFFYQGTLITYACSRVLENMGSEVSVSSARVYENNEAVVALTRKAGKVFGMHGFGNMTFIQDAMSGEVFIVEADSRPNVWFAAVRRIGVNFSQAIRQLLAGNATPHPQQEGAHILRHFYREMNRSLATGDLLTAVKWIGNVEARYSYIPWYDSMLFMYTLQLLAKTRIKAFGDAHPRLRSYKQKVASLFAPN